MKIIAFFPGVYPNGFSAMSYRLHYYMKALQSKGVEVEIVMPADKDTISGIFEDIPYSFVKATKLTRFNRKLVTNEYASICGDLASRCDVLFTTYLGNNQLNKTANLVHKAGGKIAIEINENPHSIFASRLDTSLGLFIQRQKFLKSTLKNADGIITISQALTDLISAHKNPDAIVMKVPILTGSKELEREKTYTGIPYILHAGALSEQKDGVKAMLKAFALAHKTLDGNLKFIFTNKVGFPSLLKWIDKFIAEYKLENFVEFKGMVPLSELEKLYTNCALAIVNKPSNAQNDYNFPTKLTELLPREIPVIVSRTGELKKYFIDNENAYVVEADDVEQITDKIIYIQSHPEEVKRVTQNGKLLAEKEFYYLNHADQLYHFFEQMAKK